MKSKILIKLLQEADPSGELEVVVPTEEGNVDIFFVESKAGYWDGSYHVMERDWSNKYYNIIGAQYRSDGVKLCLKTISIQDALFSNIDLPITVVDTFLEKTMQKQVDEWREEAKKIIKESFDEYFEKFKKDFIPKMLKDDLKILQPNEYPIGYHNVMWLVRDTKKFKPFDKRHYVTNENQEHLCQGDCEVIIKTGLFEPIKREKYTEWIFKGKV